MTNSFLIIIGSILMQHDLCAQFKGGIEQYHYLGQPGQAAIVPVIHLESSRGWHAEMRYNYEEMKTVSLYAGKSFSRSGTFSYGIMPMAGYAMGRLNAGTVALETEIGYKSLFFLAQSQFTAAFDREQANFFFSWSELGYTVSDRFFAGLSLQCTRQAGKSEWEPGVLAGVSFGNVSFPFYVFSPWRMNRYFVLGINYEYTLRKKKDPAGRP